MPRNNSQWPKNGGKLTFKSSGRINGLKIGFWPERRPRQEKSKWQIKKAVIIVIGGPTLFKMK